MTGIVLAVIGVAVLVVAIIALTAKDDSKSGATQTTTPGAASTPTTISPTPSRASSSTPSGGASLSPGGSNSASASDSSAKLPLIVLNNTTTNGLATDAAAQFRSAGWTVTDIGNLRNDIISTCAYYDPNVAGAQAAAKALRTQFPGIERVSERFSELPSGPVVVVLTSGYSTN